jgi:demethylmenaquinone methyltransferase / 2-methoxy-6-polyprenyl-1,4-benzoquinol methylase
MMVSQETKAAHVHRVFSRIAKRYDLMNSVLSFYQHKLWRRFAMKHVLLAEGGKALDVACGTGDWTLALAKRTGPTGEVVGIDFCEEMLEVAEEKVQRRGLSERPIKLMVGDAMALPFDDSSFDVATIGFALRNVPDILTVLKEMNRVVKPGGSVVSLELSKPEFPPFRAMYYLYFNRILPRIGALAVKEKEPYAWLPESLRNFPDRKGLEALFRQAGLRDVKSYPLTGGIAALHVGTKVED